MDLTDICKQGISSNAVAEAAAKITQFNKEKSIGINQKKKKKPPLLSFPLREALLYQHTILERAHSLCVHK